MQDLNDFFYERATLEYRWCLWPRKCYRSKRWLFCELAVRGRAIYTGPGEPVIEDRWFSTTEALILCLTKST